MAHLARHVAGERDHRRRAEEADVDARRAELCGVGGDRQIAGGDQLAAGGGGRSVHGGDHRLRAFHDRLHERRALAHDLLEEGAAAVAILAMGRQLLEVMTRAKHRPVRGEHDGANIQMRRQADERVLKRRHQRLVEAVALIRPVETEDRDRALALADEHGRAGVLGGWGFLSCRITHLRLLGRGFRLRERLHQIGVVCSKAPPKAEFGLEVF